MICCLQQTTSQDEVRTTAWIYISAVPHELLTPPLVTGWCHICDHGCLEGVIDSEGVITCPITGRTSQQLISRQEERAMQRSSADASFRGADQELSSFSLARAYTQGLAQDTSVDLTVQVIIIIWFIY